MRIVSSIFLTVCIASLSGCASIISWDRNVSVWSSGERTGVDIKLPTKDLHFNYHGGGIMNGLDRYTLTMPRHRDAVTAAEIGLIRVVDGEKRVLALGRGSTVTLTGTTSCIVEIGLSDPDGAPYVVNGVYRLKEFECRR